MKQGSRTDGKSGGSHVRYIMRTERYRYGAHELTYSESGNMPSWATQNPLEFWDAADTFERANAQVYSEFEIALPRELNDEQRLKLVKAFVAAEIGEQHPYTLAIHEVEAMDGGSNPHVHVMFTTRALDGIERPKELFFKRANSRHPEQGGAKKDRSWQPKERLLELRESWETHCNNALKRAGYDALIDRRTLTEQGIERQPEPKLSPYETMLWKHGIMSEKVEDILLLRELAAIQSQHEATKEYIATVQEMVNLEDFRARVEATLANQRKALKSSLSERDRLDRRIEQLNDKLFHAPGSKIDAFEMARDRIFGSGLNAHIETINELRAKRDEIAQALEAYGVGGALKDIPHTVKDLKDLWEAQQALNEAKEIYRHYVREMQSPEGKLECKQFAEELYGAKVVAETERNALFKEAFSIRSEIEDTEELISKTQEMLGGVQLEIREASSRLPQTLLDWINREESEMVQIAVGQDVVQRKEQDGQVQRQELKLNLSLKLGLGGDEL
ncbi:MobA/MobL family protein [Leptothoe sp. LEGE 181152]|nr:MobA/MobL family protein [Leptothoe sp. LEGE 181152]